MDGDRYCIHCGAKNSAANKFCSKCGRPLGAAQGSAASPERGIPGPQDEFYSGGSRAGRPGVPAALIIIVVVIAVAAAGFFLLTNFLPADIDLPWRADSSSPPVSKDKDEGESEGVVAITADDDDEDAASPAAVEAEGSSPAAITATVVVPDLVGKSRADALYAITAAGLTVGTIAYEESGEAGNQVIAVTPAFGEEVEKGTAVDLRLSRGSGSELGYAAFGEPVYNDPAGYVISGSSSLLLNEYDLEDLSELELTVARNEIFARHGKLFDTPELQVYFDLQPWYQDIEEKEKEVRLNDTEITNADYMSEFAVEKFGRNSYFQ
jgi:hypothetical protein